MYKPVGVKARELNMTDINLDEFEAMRLCDLEGLSQTEAASDMEVSRATIQRLLLSGRKKIIEAMLTNKGIRIENDIENIKLKGENKMNFAEKETRIIAFPTSDRMTVDGHFGHTKEFALYEVKGKQIVSKNFVTPPKHEPGVLPRFLGEQGVNVIITGGMGKMAVNLFNNQNIDVILGANGNLAHNLEEYIGGSLASTGSSCDHNHGEEHGH